MFVYCIYLFMKLLFQISYCCIPQVHKLMLFLWVGGHNLFFDYGALHKNFFIAFVLLHTHMEWVYIKKIFFVMLHHTGEAT